MELHANAALSLNMRRLLCTSAWRGCSITFLDVGVHLAEQAHEHALAHHPRPRRRVLAHVVRACSATFPSVTVSRGSSDTGGASSSIATQPPHRPRGRSTRGRRRDGSKNWPRPEPDEDVHQRRPRRLRATRRLHTGRADPARRRPRRRRDPPAHGLEQVMRALRAGHLHPPNARFPGGHGCNRPSKVSLVKLAANQGASYWLQHA